MIPRFHDLVVTKWNARFMGHHFSCAVGRGGVGQKIGEGDGITPNGVFQIMGAGYRADRLRFGSDHFYSKQIGLIDVWSDDPEDANYNHGFASYQYPYSHERLYRADHLYDLFAILDFNYPVATPGAGSAIFIHSWRKPRHPTEGCIAFDPMVLKWILTRWSEKSRVIIRA